MKHYSITYDLNKPGQRYHSLWALLLGMGARRLTASQWILYSNETADSILMRLRTEGDWNDEIAVLELASDHATHNTAFPMGRLVALAALYASMPSYAPQLGLAERLALLYGPPKGVSC